MPEETKETEEKLEIPLADGTAEAFLYHEKEGRRPGVLYLTDIGGIRESNREMARRLAGEGYTVLMPNLFYRTGRLPMFDFPIQFGEERTTQRLAELRGPLTPDAMDRDAGAYVDFLATLDSLAPGPFGVVGFCFSGGLAMRVAAARPDKIAAVASFHGGGLFTDTPASPHRLLPRIQAELYFGHAVEDRGMPEEAIKKFEQALAEWGGTFESETYEGARHGWTVLDSPVYNEPQAERAFRKLTALLGRTLRQA
jgi:carboxymethylenebutenolidase